MEGFSTKAPPAGRLGTSCSVGSRASVLASPVATGSALIGNVGDGGPQRPQCVGPHAASLTVPPSGVSDKIRLTYHRLSHSNRCWAPTVCQE